VEASAVESPDEVVPVPFSHVPVGAGRVQENDHRVALLVPVGAAVELALEAHAVGGVERLLDRPGRRLGGGRW